MRFFTLSEVVFEFHSDKYNLKFSYPALINTAMSLVNNLCMDMLRFHSDETSVVDAVSSLLAALPLEEKADALLDSGLGQPTTQTLGAQRSSVPLG